MSGRKLRGEAVGSPDYFISRLYKRMFETIVKGFSKFFTKERIFILVIFLILAWGLLTYSGSKSLMIDNMEDGSPASGPAKAHVEADHVQPSQPPAQSGGYALQPVANPSDLLPQDHNSQWAALNPNSMTQGNVLMPDLLQAGYHIGLDTIGQTLRNANLQLRSDPIIQKQQIGPWNNSTIEPEMRVPLELGQGPQ